MHHNKAILLFSKVPQINRSNRDEPFAALPWDDLDTLFTAMLGDVAEIACHVDFADVFLYRDGAELSDDILSHLRTRIEVCDLPPGSFSEQVQQAVENAFAQHYDRVVVVLDNHPLMTSTLLRNIFYQLEYEDDCIVLGPTVEGKCFLLGMKSNYSLLFSPEDGDPLINSNLLMSRLCATNVVLFPMPISYSLDSGFNLARLKQDVEMLVGAEAVFPHRTYELFKVLDKKYRTKKTLR